MNKPELLSPAGSRKAMEYAFAYGADAVYAGQPRYSLRVRENEFNRLDVLADAVKQAHQLGKKFFIASNLSPHNDKVRSYLKDMEPVIAMAPDALIMSDPGLIMMVRERWPDMPIHLSVQANAVNYATVQFWQSVGLARVILSRELGLNEIQEIRERCPDIELEVFVHGALCIAYSGRCLLSGYMTHRDANQGACTNACRWQYSVQEAQSTPEGDVTPVQSFNPAQDKIFLLEEKGRPGETMPAFEDEHGTYIMNSRDLRAVQHVQRLMEIGVDSLKIEGRTKTHFYAARTAQVYRQAIDDAAAGKTFNLALMDQLEALSNRGYTEGFYRRHIPAAMQNYETGNSTSDKQQFVGEVIDCMGNTLLLDVKNKFSLGDTLELMTPLGNYAFCLEHMTDCHNNPMVVAKGSGYKVKIPVPGIQQMIASSGSFQHALLMRTLP